MKLKGIEVDFDFMDADDIKKFEVASKKFMEKCDKYGAQEMDASEVLIKQCEIIEEFFDEVFGNNISAKIFKKKHSLREHVDIYEEIIRLKLQDEANFKNKFNRYQPRKEKKYGK